MSSESEFKLFLSAWKEELTGDPDRKLILQGLIHDVDIIYNIALPHPPPPPPPPPTLHHHPTSSTIHSDNHTAAKQGSPLYKKACKQVQKEIEIGLCEAFFSDPATIISPIGSIQMPDDGIRLIHDYSRPV